VPSPSALHSLYPCTHGWNERRLTDPIDIKKPNVAADESIYCDIVAIAPLGPGPPLDI
jgi:hypothetical protein